MGTPQLLPRLSSYLRGLAGEEDTTVIFIIVQLNFLLILHVLK